MVYFVDGKGGLIDVCKGGLIGGGGDISLSSLTPPPIPSPTKDPFSRSLAPLEPQHPSIPSYLNTQRRGSITDPSLHLSVPNPELSRQYSQPDVHFSSNSSERRSSLANVDQYPLSPSSTLSRPSSVKSDHQLFSSLESRKLRDSTLPSISASPSPVRDGFPGSLMNPAFQAQLQTRRHSIAVVKRRESIGDPAIQRLSLYDRRNYRKLFMMKMLQY
ncbi:4837_t:CDS:2 [Entrophospora sp. SA101]|nr:4837_t:CDS:2 [Entrophospora sp. SA101]